MKEASYYKKKIGNVQCLLCPRQCIIAEGAVGFCRVRKNIGGRLESLVYGEVSGVQIDPIEKKPLFHFKPGSRIFSIGTVGCNLRCKFCQNYHISQVGGNYPLEELTPDNAIELALKYGCESIAYTYNEPTVFFEYMLDIAKLARKKGLKNVMVSNGFINPKPLSEISKYLDGANIDLKAFTSRFYGSVSAAWLPPILKTLQALHRKKVWLEITNLIIPHQNDRKEEITAMCAWIHKHLGADVPLHFTAYYPTFQMKEPPTPPALLLTARKIALDTGLHYVYVGNVISKDAENTFCWKCGKLLIKRNGFAIESNNILSGKCAFCNAKIPGVF